MKVTIDLDDDLARYLATGEHPHGDSGYYDIELHELAALAVKAQAINVGDKVASQGGLAHEVLAVAGDLFWCRRNGNQPVTFHRAALTKIEPS